MANRAKASLSLIVKVVAGAIGTAISPRMSMALESVTPKKVTAGLVIDDVPVLQAIIQTDATNTVSKLTGLHPVMNLKYPVCISISLPLFLSSLLAYQRNKSATDYASNAMQYEN
jgi:hypothetical protein